MHVTHVRALEERSCHIGLIQSEAGSFLFGFVLLSVVIAHVKSYLLMG